MYLYLINLNCYYIPEYIANYNKVMTRRVRLFNRNSPMLLNFSEFTKWKECQKKEYHSKKNCIYLSQDNVFITTSSRNNSIPK